MLPDSWQQWVVQAPPPLFTGAVAAAAVVAALALWFGFRFWARSRLIEDTPTSKIRSAAQGYVELAGQGALMAGTPVVSPLTGQVCTWYSYKVEERTETTFGGDENRREWRTIETQTSDNLFLLQDGTGECVIDPDGAAVTTTHSETWYGDMRGPRLSGSGGMLGGLLGTERYRFTERRMLPGDPLYAIGYFRTIGGAQDLSDRRQEVAALLRRWKANQQELLRRFDADGDGHIDAQEWEQARREAQREVLEDEAERMRRAPDNVLSQPADGRPFILSVLPEDALAQRYRWYARGAFLGFVLGTAATLWLLTTRLAA